MLMAGEPEELPLMGCPDGADSVCNNVTIPAVILYSHDQQILQGENLQVRRGGPRLLLGSPCKKVR